MESGLVCFRDLAFFNFLLPLVDAMVFPLPFGLPLWAVGPFICKSESKCPVQRERNSSRAKCGGCNYRISLARPRAPEITLNKSTYVEKFNLIQRQAFKAADTRTANAQLKTGECRVETRTAALGGHFTVSSRPGSPVSDWQPHARQPTDQETELTLLCNESGLVCFRTLAFPSFLVDFFDAMVFLLRLSCPQGRSVPCMQIRGQMSSPTRA